MTPLLMLIAVFAIIGESVHYVSCKSVFSVKPSPAVDRSSEKICVSSLVSIQPEFNPQVLGPMKHNVYACTLQSS